jgi:hypothetical protein
MPKDKSRATTSVKRNVQPAWLRDPDVMVFVTERELPIGGIQQHSLGAWVGNLFGRTKEEVRADWEKVLDQMRFLLDKVSTTTKDYELDELTFQLGFSAEGKIVFVAKAGVTTTISAKFKRKDSA